MSDEAAALLAVLQTHGLTVATAESLTAGLVAAALADIPGASAHLRGGLVTYATELKHRLAGVDAATLAERGPVDAEVAAQMAVGAAQVCGADVGIATTGVAGPGPQGSHPAGTGFLAVHMCGPAVTISEPFAFTGTRNEVRARVVQQALVLARTLVQSTYTRP